MKRRPDGIIALVIIFCIGLAVSGFTSIFSASERSQPPASVAMVMPAIR